VRAEVLALRAFKFGMSFFWSSCERMLMCCESRALGAEVSDFLLTLGGSN
jgi:hypothetical protein